MVAITTKGGKEWLPFLYPRVECAPKSPQPFLMTQWPWFFHAFAACFAFLWHCFTPPSIVYLWFFPGPLSAGLDINFCMTWGFLFFHILKLKNASLWQTFLKSTMLLTFWSHCCMKTADCCIMGPRQASSDVYGSWHHRLGGHSLWSETRRPLW